MHESDADVPDPRAHDPHRGQELGAAYQRAMDSYDLARRLVYDRYPGGLPDRGELTDDERGLLAEFESAERSLDALRRDSRDSDGDPTRDAAGDLDRGSDRYLSR